MPLIDPVTMSTNPPAPAALKTSLPIELLPTDLARITTAAHPALLLSLYYLRFPALVSDPATTLLHTLLHVAVIQSAYAIVCLPAAGTSSTALKKPKPGEKRKGGSSVGPVVRFPPSPIRVFEACTGRLYGKLIHKV
jgi:hypothetical protein